MHRRKRSRRFASATNDAATVANETFAVKKKKRKKTSAETTKVPIPTSDLFCPSAPILKFDPQAETFPEQRLAAMRC